MQYFSTIISLNIFKDCLGRGQGTNLGSFGVIVVFLSNGVPWTTPLLRICAVQFLFRANNIEKQYFLAFHTKLSEDCKNVKWHS